MDSTISHTLWKTMADRSISTLVGVSLSCLCNCTTISELSSSSPQKQTTCPTPPSRSRTKSDACTSPQWSCATIDRLSCDECKVGLINEYSLIVWLVVAQCEMVACRNFIVADLASCRLVAEATANRSLLRLSPVKHPMIFPSDTYRRGYEKHDEI